MSLVQLERLEKSFGAQILFYPFSAAIARGEKIALVGGNGVGKSTLLAILAGEEKPSGGNVHLSRGTTVGYLHQIARFEEGVTLIEAMNRPFATLIAMERKLRELEKKMAITDDVEMMHRYDDLLHTFEREGGYEIDARIRSVLSGVGFKADEFDKPISLLSGGEEARAALARSLVEAPDLLLLDEPTNHLDFAALDWLEDTLTEYAGALVVVSHDRHLLDHVTNRTWEIAFAEISTYRGGYTASRGQRNAQIAQRQERYDEQQATIARYKDFINRHHAGQKHRQAKDRERKLVHLEKELVDRPREARRISLSIPAGPSSGKIVLRINKLEVGYGKALFICPTISLDRGERVAIIGENGCGKTTFLKTAIGAIPPRSGDVCLGHGVRPVTYTQKQEELRGSGTVLDMILSRSTLNIGQARGLLGRFLFSGDDATKKLNALSGGERSRVALAILSLMEGNLLLLDEPTNHLDLRSQEILEQALLEYKGTIILVSHDRALLEALATQVWQIEDGSLYVFKHGFAEYRRRRARAAARQEEEIVSTPSHERRPPGKKSNDRRDTKKRAMELARIEEEIARLEKELSQVEHALAAASDSSNSEEITRLGLRHHDLSADLEKQMHAWEQTAREEPVDE